MSNIKEFTITTQFPFLKGLITYNKELDALTGHISLMSFGVDGVTITFGPTTDSNSEIEWNYEFEFDAPETILELDAYIDVMQGDIMDALTDPLAYAWEQGGVAVSILNNSVRVFIEENEDDNGV